MLNNKEKEITKQTRRNKWNTQRNINESDIDQHSSFLYKKNYIK